MFIKAGARRFLCRMFEDSCLNVHCDYMTVNMINTYQSRISNLWTLIIEQTIHQCGTYGKILLLFETHGLPLVLQAEKAMSKLFEVQVLLPLKTPASWHQRVTSLLVASAPLALVANSLTNAPNIKLTRDWISARSENVERRKIEERYGSGNVHVRSTRRNA